MSRMWENVGVGKDIVLFRGIVRFWEVYAERGVVVLLQWL